MRLRDYVLNVFHHVYNAKLPQWKSSYSTLLYATSWTIACWRLDEANFFNVPHHSGRIRLRGLLSL
jgi:hypothetical protein